MKLSVLMSVYAKESPLYLRQSLESLAVQTRRADEIVLVEDGPLPAELGDAIAEIARVLPVTSVRLPAQLGLGTALREGLGACCGEFVARMDSDDICAAGRFARQLDFFNCNPQVDVVGGAIAEFRDDPRRVESIRRLPEDEHELRWFARYRNPLNHMTVMFRKSSVLDAGSYQPCEGFEDYHLWARMLAHGAQLRNLPEVLVHVRCGNGMHRRRGGLSYLRREVVFQRFLHRTGLASLSDCARNMLLRAPLRIAPVFIRSLCYAWFLREPAPQGREFKLE